jgi:uncharacterized protein
MSISITASMLYNLVECPHRLSLDLQEDPANRDPESKFIQLLWEKGTVFEKEIIHKLKIPYTDLSERSSEERERLTAEAMSRCDGLIYAGRIRADDLLGDPDLLRRQSNGYVAGDIKSGAGLEGESDFSDGKPKMRYAVQLALYTDILEKMQVSAGRHPFIWDIHSKEVLYDLEAPQGPKTPENFWQFYQNCLKKAIDIVSRNGLTMPALSSICKLCHWHSICLNRLIEMNDLTLIPELGRTKRDAMLKHIRTVKELATTNIAGLIRGDKTVIPKIGPGTLKKFQERARLQTNPNATPYLKKSLDLPENKVELFFDIEVDPMRDICYLHGFVERHNQNTPSERYVPFFAESPTAEEEEKAFSLAWKYVQSSKPCSIYFYSKYERTWWRKLQKRYPHIASENQVEAMFDPKIAVDLYYDVVLPHSEWPTRNHSIKTLASFLGFNWRDSNPSGADSIEWYHRWIETGDSSVRQRILDYNEDDCIATRVLLDGIRNMSIC